MRIVFFGTTHFSAVILRALLGYPGEILGVVTQPDRPAGRGRRLRESEAKALAAKRGLTVHTPEDPNSAQFVRLLEALEADLFAVAAYGHIFGPSLLAAPACGCVNVHASLLPRWRGAAPIQAAILAGDDRTGVTILRMDPGVDTGPLLSQTALTILPDENATSLSQRLADLGAAILIETLPLYLRGQILPRPQEPSGATYAPMLKKEDGWLDTLRPATELARRVRALNPWPGAYILWQGQPLKIHRAHVIQDIPEFVPGARLIYEHLPALGTGQGLLLLDEIQPAGKKPMPGGDFLHGARDWAA